MTKEKVLEYFEKGKGEIISGAELAEALGVTRTAIWKIINSLREEGYDIESIKKKGYRLNINSDILSTIKIKSILEEEKYDLRIHKTIDSTNRAAKLAAILEEEEWIVIASEEQERGKGRGQSDFASPNGKGVYMSLVLRPRVNIDKRSQLIDLSSRAVIKGIKELTGAKMDMQRPNDMMYQGKKLGGILSEVILELETGCIEALVIGIGINVYGTPEEFGGEGDISTSLNQILGKYCNRSELIGVILNQISQEYQIFKKEMK